MNQQNLPFDHPPPASQHHRKRGAERAIAQASVEAFEAIKTRRSKLYLPILEVIAEHGPEPEDCLTAREILRVLKARNVLPPDAERNAVAPRQTELFQAGCIERLDLLKQVAGDSPAHTWRITERGHLFAEHLRREQQKSGQVGHF